MVIGLNKRVELAVYRVALPNCAMPTVHRFALRRCPDWNAVTVYRIALDWLFTSAAHTDDPNIIWQLGSADPAYLLQPVQS
jgi:hypothetical protein